MTKRGPLRFIILAATGLDVDQCAACGCCYVDDSVQAEFDLEIWEVLAAACENKQGALTNRTIWALAKAQPKDVNCFIKLDVVAVAQALCREAKLRDLAPRSATGGRRGVSSTRCPVQTIGRSLSDK